MPFTRTFIENGKFRSYEIDGVPTSDMARSALAYMNVQPAHYATLDAYAEALDEANRFATYCVTETFDLDSGTCDPTFSFRDLWRQFLQTIK